MFGIDKWAAGQGTQFGKQFHVSEHKLHEQALFSRESLVKLLDNIPKRNIQCYTMAPNAEAIDSIAAVNADACDGNQILTAAESGLFWFNVKQLEAHNKEFAALINTMFQEICVVAPHIDPTELSCNLLMTSPAAHTHYHIDRGPTMLWHLSGRKRLWVYPEMDDRFIPQHNMEELFAGERLEYMPYEPAFDDHAIEHEILPGQMVAWPNTAPHRVENIDFNVSLVVSYATSASIKRANLQRANHFMLKPLGVKHRSLDENTVAANIKHFAFRASNKVLKYKPKVDFKESFSTTLKVSLDKDGGIVDSGSDTKPEFLN